MTLQCLERSVKCDESVCGEEHEDADKGVTGSTSTRLRYCCTEHRLTMKTLIAIVLLQLFVFGCHEDEIEEVDEVPLWQLSHQDVWYYAASIHADLRSEGTPQWARDVWDEIVLIDPNAPMEYRPFWEMKSGGLTALAPAFYDEIRERTAAGYRVIYTSKGGSQSPEPEDAADVAGLGADVETMAALEVLPWEIGLWNELEFGGSGIAEELQQFSDKMTFVAPAGRIGLKGS
jgi:hypothetical protein